MSVVGLSDEARPRTRGHVRYYTQIYT